MTLDEIKRSCEAEAKLLKVETVDENGNKIIKGYQELSKNELGNGYCDWDEVSAFSKDEQEVAKAEQMKSYYWAALLLRYWYKIFAWMSNSASLQLPPEEFFYWLNASLEDAFFYRSWRKLRRKELNNPDSEWIENPHYKEMEDNAVVDRSINWACSTRRGAEYQAVNKYKRKANTQAISIDKTFDEDGYSILDREGLCSNSNAYNGIRSLINLFLEQGKEIDALIIDGIAYGDCMKEEKIKYDYAYYDDRLEKEVHETNYRYKHEFNARKLVKQLTEINEQFFLDYFNKEYKVKDYKPILEKLKKLNNSKLYQEIERTLSSIQQNKELANFIQK